MINLDKQLVQEIEESSCFGIAYDSEVPECKQCDLTAQCKAKSALRLESKSLPAQELEESIPSKKTTKKPSKKSTTTKKKPETTKKKSTTTKKKPETVKKEDDIVIPGEMPEFKGMPWEDIEKIAKDNGVTWKDYGNDNITRMRLVMTLKKMYK